MVHVANLKHWPTTKQEFESPAAIAPQNPLLKKVLICQAGVIQKACQDPTFPLGYLMRTSPLSAQF